MARGWNRLRCIEHTEAAALGAHAKEGAEASLASDVMMQRDALRGEQDAQASLTARTSAKQESALEGEVREDDDHDLRWRAEAVDAPVMEQARTDQVANAPAQVNGSSGMTAEQARVHEIAQRLVKAVHVGQDQRARKVVMMDIEVPGYGNLRARLTRQGDGIEVRLRAEDPALSRLLRSQRGTLADQARANGVTLRQIDVVDSGDL